MFRTENRNSLRSKAFPYEPNEISGREKDWVFRIRDENGVRAKWSKEECGQIQRVHAIKRDETLKPSETTTNLLSLFPLDR